MIQNVLKYDIGVRNTFALRLLTLSCHKAFKAETWVADVLKLELNSRSAQSQALVTSVFAIDRCFITQNMDGC